MHVPTHLNALTRPPLSGTHTTRSSGLQCIVSGTISMLFVVSLVDNIAVNIEANQSLFRSRQTILGEVNT